MKNKQWYVTGILVACMTSAPAVGQTVDINILNQRMFDACPAIWEDVTADIDPSAISGDVWNGDSTDKETFKTFLAAEMGASAPTIQELEVMATDPSTVASECATQRLGFLDGLMDKIPTDVITALNAVSEQMGHAGWGYGMVPPGAVMAFNLSTCPTGWSPMTAAEGRYVVGLPSDGTLAATVGTELSDQENRAVGRHNHVVDPPATSTSTGGSHRHGGIDGGNWGNHSGGDNDTSIYHEKKTKAAGNHNHSVNIGPFNSADAGGVSGTNAPYIQLLYCEKN
ncbi:MAG TPA: hypothetical protein VK973_04765 [Arenicellales bacterium]|nr:hypothetical protein [Arenicellales bacterium]